MKTGLDFAENALLPKWDKYTYDRLDCQGFVEAVLKDLGIKKPDGSWFDWRGSNSMYRHYYSWRGTVDECIKKFGSVPVGSFVYIWKETGEEEVGYHDGLGNCTHVGIYCGNDVVRDSTRSTKTGRNGVGTRSLKNFNRVTLFQFLDYNVNNQYNADVERVMAVLDNIHNELITMEGILNELFRSNKAT